MLNDCIQWLYDHVEALENQPVGGVMAFNFASGAPTTRAASFPVGVMTLDNMDQTQATSVLVSSTTSNGADAGLALSSTVSGTKLVLQQVPNATQYAIATMNGEPQDHG